MSQSDDHQAPGAKASGVLVVCLHGKELAKTAALTPWFRMATDDHQDLLSVGGFGSLSERLSKMRHDVRGCLTIIVSGCDMVRLKPELTEKYLTQFSEKSKKIIELIDSFSKDFERNSTLCDQLSLILPKFKYGPQGQEASARVSLKTQSAECTALEVRLRQLRTKALQAALKPQVDEQELQDLAMQVAEIEVKLTVLRAKALAAVIPELTETQKTGILQAAGG